MCKIWHFCLLCLRKVRKRNLRNKTPTNRSRSALDHHFHSPIIPPRQTPWNQPHSILLIYSSLLLISAFWRRFVSSVCRCPLTFLPPFDENPLIRTSAGIWAPEKYLTEITPRRRKWKTPRHVPNANDLSRGQFDLSRTVMDAFLSRKTIGEKCGVLISTLGVLHAPSP